MINLNIAFFLAGMIASGYVGLGILRVVQAYQRRHG